MATASTLYLVHKNLQKLCVYRGAQPRKVIDESAFISSMTNPGYSIIMSIRPDSDVRGGARIIILQFSFTTPDTKQQYIKAISTAILIATEDSGSAAGTKSTEAREVIVVTPDEPVSALYSALEIMRASASARTTFEVYPMTKFMIVVPEHIMVPRHDILREPEIAQLCDTLHIARNTLPIIRSDDPVAIWLGLRPRMVVRVHRFVDTVGIDIAYQRCV